MSWDARLTVYVDDHGINVFDVNYTHNCNGILYEALSETIVKWDGSWWQWLNEKSAVEAGPVLARMVESMIYGVKQYRPMEPDNGWGDYDSVLRVITKMAVASFDYPSGTWSAKG